MNYKYILLDWDGCLADTLGVWLETTRAGLNKYGVYIPDSEIVSKVFGNWNAFKERVGEENYKKAVDELVLVVNERLSKVPLHLQVKETLIELKKRGKKLAIVSSSKRSTVLPSLEYHELNPYIDAVVCVDDVTRFKPDPESIYKALDCLQGNPEEAVIVGDSEKDILAGRNANVSTILYYPKINQSFYSLDTLKSLKPDFLITNFSQVLDLV